VREARRGNPAGLLRRYAPRNDGLFTKVRWYESVEIFWGKFGVGHCYAPNLERRFYAARQPALARVPQFKKPHRSGAYTYAI